MNNEIPSEICEHRIPKVTCNQCSGPKIKGFRKLNIPEDDGVGVEPGPKVTGTRKVNVEARNQVETTGPQVGTRKLNIPEDDGVGVEPGPKVTGTRKVNLSNRE